jgi:hypothetical protein
MKKTLLLFMMAHYACTAMAAPVQSPRELDAFVEPGTKLLSFHSADLNGDGAKDYVVVLQHNDEAGTRPLLILGRDTVGALKLLKRNEQIVGCATCGGSMGDPFQSVEVREKGFTVSNAGGSIDRWSNSFTFAYSRRDKTWQLVRAEVSSYYAPDADSTEKSNIYLPPKDFGKIDIADFDPDRYLKVRSRR